MYSYIVYCIQIFLLLPLLSQWNKISFQYARVYQKDNKVSLTLNLNLKYMSVGSISDHNRKGINDTRGVKKSHRNVTVYLILEQLKISGKPILHHLLLLHEGRSVVGLSRPIFVVSMAARPLCHSSVPSVIIFNMTLSSPSDAKPRGLSSPQKRQSLI